jgi:hypothetical protein
MRLGCLLVLRPTAAVSGTRSRTSLGATGVSDDLLHAKPSVPELFRDGGFAHKSSALPGTVLLLPIFWDPLRTSAFVYNLGKRSNQPKVSHALLSRSPLIALQVVY